MKSNNVTDSDEGINKHFIPPCFFEHGPYEVWAKKRSDGPVCLIAQNLSLKTAQSFSWVGKEIRLNGKVCPT